MAKGNVRFFSVSTEDKQCALDDAWDATADNGSFRDTLRIFEKDARSIFADGATTMASASNGHSQTNFAPGEGAPAPVEFARVWRELINRFDAAKAWLQNPTAFDGGTVPAAIANPSDDQVYAQMKVWLVKITEAQSDYSLMRITGAQYV